MKYVAVPWSSPPPPPIISPIPTFWLFKGLPVFFWILPILRSRENAFQDGRRTLFSVTLPLFPAYFCNLFLRSLPFLAPSVAPSSRKTRVVLNARARIVTPLSPWPASPTFSRVFFHRHTLFVFYMDMCRCVCVCAKGTPPAWILFLGTLPLSQPFAFAGYSFSIPMCNRVFLL